MLEGDRPAAQARTAADPALEAELVAAIEPWLAHMAWRSNFEAWRERRIYQEEHQEGNLRDLARALGPDPAGRSVLDLGAGMGGLSVAIMRRFGPQGVALQAMDYNPDYCRIAALRARRHGLTLSIAVAAGEALPYSDGQFDVITCLDVLEHVASPGVVLSEMHRVLKPGGAVLTTVPNRRAFRDPHYHLPFINWLPRPLASFLIRRMGRSKESGLLKDRQEHADLQTYTWAEFKRLATRSGFSIRDQVYWRISHGEVRQLRGVRRALLGTVIKLGIFSPLYRLYRYGWQGTYQILLKR